MKYIFPMALIAIVIAMVAISSTGCEADITPLMERSVATVSAESIYETNLLREVKKSKENIRSRERNDFFGFSPEVELKMLRGNLSYLIEATALVLPAGSLSREKVIEESEKRSEALAKDIYERLKKGEDWNKLSNEYSIFEGKEEGGKLPVFTPDSKSVPADFYKLKPGEVLEPQKSMLDWLIYRLDNVSETPEGEPQYEASVIMVSRDEDSVKEEMIEDILTRKTVVITDLAIRGYDLYSRGDYKTAIATLKDASPIPKWPDLGYYVMALSADKLRDETGRLEYLQKAVSAASEGSGFIPYYTLEIGDIMKAKGDPSAKDYYRKSFDESSNDYTIVKETLARFQEIGDQEYIDKVSARKKEMDSIIQGSTGGGPSQGKVVTGDVTPDKPDFSDL